MSNPGSNKKSGSQGGHGRSKPSAGRGSDNLGTSRPGDGPKRPLKEGGFLSQDGRGKKEATRKQERSQKQDGPKKPKGAGKQKSSQNQKRPPKHGSSPGSDEVRLNKFIAASGVCSRREADQLISAGLITVNGTIITQLGTKVKPDDDVRYNGSRVQNQRKVYLLLNKPKDYVTTTDDPRERKTVMLLVRDACTERIYPVGRLDRQTTGVLLFTNDGDLVKKLTHPRYNKKKIYHVFLDKGVSGGDLKKLADGVTLEDGFIQPDAISYVSGDNKKEIGLEIHSGRNRIVRRMFEHLGYRVTKLDRVYFAGLTKKNLPRGKWRFLTEDEVGRMKMNAYE